MKQSRSISRTNVYTPSSTRPLLLGQEHLSSLEPDRHLSTLARNEVNAVLQLFPSRSRASLSTGLTPVYFALL